MKAHIVGGGFGGLAAAALLIRNSDMSSPDITIYEADEKLGGGFFLAGDAKSGYNLPGSIFDREFRCALDLLGKIPTQLTPISMLQSNSSLSIKNTRLSTKLISSIGTSAACMTSVMG
jgi:myosin-crossreactive antigen